MNYEKAYKAVLKTAQQWIEDGCTDKERICLESVFPELRESEDERIRKELVAFFKGMQDSDWHEKYWHDLEIDRILSWIEKQKEQCWIPTEGEMGVLYKLCYLSNQISDDDDTELTRLYQDLKREYFNGHSFENMFPKQK